MFLFYVSACLSANTFTHRHKSWQHGNAIKGMQHEGEMHINSHPAQTEPHHVELLSF